MSIIILSSGIFNHLLVEEITLIHAFGDSHYSAGLNSNPVELNMVRLVQKHFTSQLTSTTNKAGVQRKYIWCRKMASHQDTDFSRCNVTLCLNECRETLKKSKNDYVCNIKMFRFPFLLVY